MLPQTMATGNIHIGTITGKLNGVMPATTPSGWRSEWLSTFVPTFSVISPLSSCGAPVANSTTSRPRVTSPIASSCTLPCSLVMSAASASWFCSQSSRNFAMMRARRSGGVAAHAGNAAFAAAIAFATSSWLASGHARLQGAERRVEDVAEPAARAVDTRCRRCSAEAFPGGHSLSIGNERRGHQTETAIRGIGARNGHVSGSWLRA